jgi:hypothetical protein
VRFAILALLVLGCQPRPDGSYCEGDLDCDSGACVGNYCLGSSCGAQAHCEPGWDCVGLGSPGWCFWCSGAGDCMQPCTADADCPATWICEGYCRFEPEFEVDIGGPYVGVVDEPIRFTDTIVPPPGYRVLLRRWSFGLYPDGDEVSYAFTTPFEGNVSLTVTVQDEHLLESTAYASAQLQVCTPEIEPCTSPGMCCAPNECRTIVSTYNDTEVDYCVPPDPGCDSVTDEATCIQTSLCEWVDIACDTITPVGRCQTIIACDTDADCPGDLRCESTVYDPCVEKGVSCGCYARSRCG